MPKCTSESVPLLFCHILILGNYLLTQPSLGFILLGHNFKMARKYFFGQCKTKTADCGLQTADQG